MAHFCDFSEEDYYYNTVSNQEDVNTKYQGCTEIYGSIAIALNYTGSFYLANVTSISRSLLTFSSLLSMSSTGDATPNLTSIELPDLNSVGYIGIFGTPALTTMLLPSLTNVSSESFQMSNIGSASLNFPSLVAVAKGFFVSGDTTR